MRLLFLSVFGVVADYLRKAYRIVEFGQEYVGGLPQKLKPEDMAAAILFAEPCQITIAIENIILVSGKEMHTSESVSQLMVFYFLSVPLPLNL